MRLARMLGRAGATIQLFVWACTWERCTAPKSRDRTLVQLSVVEARGWSTALAERGGPLALGGGALMASAVVT